MLKSFGTTLYKINDIFFLLLFSAIDFFEIGFFFLLRFGSDKFAAMKIYSETRVGTTNNYRTEFLEIEKKNKGPYIEPRLKRPDTFHILIGKLFVLKL